MSAIDADPDIVGLFDIADVDGHELQPLLLKTASEAGMREADVTVTKARIGARGGDDRALTTSAPLCDYVQRLADGIVGPGTDIRTWRFKQRPGR